MELTDRQTEAVQQNGLFTLAACPGSGKTVVVASRIKRLIDSGDLQPYQGVAAISFTRIARDSIQETFRDMNGLPSKHPHFIGTFDSFLNQYVFLPFSHLISNSGKPMTILDVESTWLSEKIFPMLKSEKIIAEKVFYKVDGSFGYTGRELPQEKLVLIKKKTKELNLATQSDVTYYSLEILRNNPKILQALLTKFPYIIVDEAQDCSDIQMEIVNTLVTAGHCEIMLSGDPYQSIYEWRDAKPSLFIQKTNEKGWASLSLNHNQRSGQAICDVLNKFVEPSNITSDPSRTELVDAEVAFIESADPVYILERFLELTEAKGISTSPENIAVLYRAHGSAMNTKTTIDYVNSWWAGSIDKVEMLGTTVLPVKIAYLMKTGSYAEAFKFSQHFFYFQMHKELLRSTDENKLLFENIEVKKILWKFCRTIPSLKQDLNQWIEKTNSLIAATVEAFSNLGLNIVGKQVSIKKKLGFNENPNIWEVLSERGIERDDILIENIHQIKGRSFDAALIYVESSAKKAMSAQKIKNILASKEMFDTVTAEDGRCFYVAASRAKRLLCIATTDKELIQALL